MGTPLLARRIAALAGAFVLLGLFAAPAGSGCGSARACSGFDNCEDTKPCPHARCKCDSGETEVDATCDKDGICITSMDCAKLCEKAGSSCKAPPQVCGDLTVTECACTADGLKTAFASVWNCEGSSDKADIGDCAKACNLPEKTESSSSSMNPVGVGGGF